MAKTYGQDLRERVIAAVEAGASRRAAAKRKRCSATLGGFIGSAQAV